MIKFYHISPYILEISWPAEISEDILAEMTSLKGVINNYYSPLLKDCVCGYYQMALLFKVPYDYMREKSTIHNLYKSLEPHKFLNGNLWKVPVYYNGKDLDNLSSSLNIPVTDIISLHTAKKYLVHFYGFMPGFLYLGGLNSRLHHPRKENPDKTVPAGSVAIGGQQTGIYPFESPGGWHIIGSCPVKLFDPNSDPAVWAKQGDKIQFYSVEQKEFESMKLQGNGLIKDSNYA